MNVFKNGDMVLCVEAGGKGYGISLTVGNRYIVTDVDGLSFINVVNDLGNDGVYSTNRFISVCKHRISVIDEILD